MLRHAVFYLALVHAPQNRALDGRDFAALVDEVALHGSLTSVLFIALVTHVQLVHVRVTGNRGLALVARVLNVSSQGADVFETFRATWARVRFTYKVTTN